MSNINCQISNAKCHMLNVKCQMSNVNCQLSNVKYQMANVKCKMSNVKCPACMLKQSNANEAMLWKRINKFKEINNWGRAVFIKCSWYLCIRPNNTYSPKCQQVWSQHRLRGDVACLLCLLMPDPNVTQCLRCMLFVIYASPYSLALCRSPPLCLLFLLIFLPVSLCRGTGAHKHTHIGLPWISCPDIANLT